MKVARFLALALTAVMLLSACGPTPEVVEVEKVVEKPVVETVVVEKEVVVTQVVEVPVEVTAPPEPEVAYAVPSPEDPGAGLEQFDFSGITIRTIFWDIPMTHVWAERSKIFEEKTGAKVEWEIGTEEEIRLKLELDNVSKTGNYTMVLVDNWELATKVESGILTPIDDYVTDKPYPWFNDPTPFCKVCTEGMTYKGRLWGLPWALEVGQMAYRKDIFDKYGIEVPTTTDELTEVCKTLTENFEKDGVDMYCIAMRARRGEDNPIQSAGWAASYGGVWLDEDFVPRVNEPEYVEGIKWFTDILRNYGPPDVANYTWMEVQTAFGEEQVAIIVDGEPVTSRFQDPSVGAKVVDKMGWAVPPKGPVTYPTHLFLPGWGINAYASLKVKEATWVYITWITSDALIMNMLPDIPGVDFLPSQPLIEALKDTDPAIPPMVEITPYMEPTYMPVIPEYPELRDILGNYVSSIVAGEIEAQEAMDKAAEEMYEVLEKAGYYD